MSSRLIDSLATTDALAEVFSDQSILQAMLDFEAALARAEAKAGVIPGRAAESISAAARAEGLDAAAIAREARGSGTVSIPLVNALTARVEAHRCRERPVRALRRDEPGRCGHGHGSDHSARARDPGG